MSLANSKSLTAFSCNDASIALKKEKVGEKKLKKYFKEMKRRKGERGHGHLILLETISLSHFQHSHPKRYTPYFAKTHENIRRSREEEKQAERAPGKLLQELHGSKLFLIPTQMNR